MPARGLLLLGLSVALAPLAGALAPPLRRALKVAKPLVIELQVEQPEDAWHLDIEELSSRLRTAGAAALIAPRELLATFASEQAAARGNFPGPLPLLCEVGADGWQAALAAAQDANVAGISVRCGDASSAEALTELLEATTAAGLECLVMAGARELVDVAQAGGASAVACDYADASPSDGSSGGGDAAAASSAAPPVVLGAWDGDDDELARLRAAGFGGLLLLDGVGGQLAEGSAYCESRVRAHRSKASKEWGGSMFASTNSDVAPPSVRNPRMWAQSQRQAREIMHESAKSRGLPPPKIKRNTVL